MCNICWTASSSRGSRTFVGAKFQSPLSPQDCTTRFSPNNGLNHSQNHPLYSLYMHDGPPSSSLRDLPSGTARSLQLPDDFCIHAESSTTLSSKPATSFTTSRSIAVEGAIPIYSDERTESVALPLIDLSPHQPVSSGSKRAPRKSKTDALVALHTHDWSPSPSREDPSYQDSENIFSASRPSIPVSPTLDLSTVKTASRVKLPPRMTPRPFDLEDCPTFYPTAQQFQDPMEYIRSISGRAVNFGMCKIVPPVGWKMPFMTDTKVILHIFVGHAF